MATCPACQSNLPDDFGLIDCPSCGTGLFVEFDGSVRLREENAPASSPEPQSAANLSGIEPSFELNFPVGQEPILEPLPGESPPEAEEQHEPPHTSATMASPFSQIYSEPQAEPSVAPTDDEIPLNPAPPLKISPTPIATPGVDDLVDYGNSLGSAARDGVLHYDLHISGIDTADIRRSIQEALTDSLFLWDVETLMKSAHLGELKIRQVPSVKAAIVVQRLASLPIEITWVQHALLEP